MRAGVVRERILREHATLRRIVRPLEEVADLVLGGERELGDALRALAFALAERLELHLTLEDEVLIPAVREADPWGPGRAEAIAAEHASQRKALVRIREQVAREDDPEVARTSLALAAALSVDMHHEERDVLSTDVLRDDVVAIGCEAG
jgi:hypothetical protein